MNALTYATAQLFRVLPRARLNRAMGRLAEWPWNPLLGKAVVGVYRRVYDISVDECLQQDGWRSFDEFFTRELKTGARPVHPEPSVVVSPADGRLDAQGPVDRQSTFMVKGSPYDVADLVGDPEDAARYEGGAGCVIYLSPRDYHRVHAPVDGRIVRVRSMPGDYYPVNAVGVRHISRLFARNRRVAISIDTPAESGLGRVTLVMVAAMIVGRITVKGVEERDVPFGLRDVNLPIARGEELGVFHLGSTVVMLFERHACGRWRAGEGPIRFGAPLLERTAAGGLV